MNERTRLETRMIARAIVDGMQKQLRALTTCNWGDSPKQHADDKVDALVFEMRGLLIQLAAHFDTLDEQDMQRLQRLLQDTKEVPIGERILICRRRRNWSQADLAEKVGVSVATVTRWETGATTPPNAQQVRIVQAMPELFASVAPEVDDAETR